MSDLTVTITTDGNYAIDVTDTSFKVGLAEYGGYGPAGADSTVPGPTGPQGPAGPAGTTSANDINVTVDGASTDLQTAITQLSQLFFQQSGVPTIGVNEGDIWYDTTENVLKVYQNAVWVTVIAQPNLDAAVINGGWF